MIVRPGCELLGTDGVLGAITAVLVDPAEGAATHLVATIDRVPGSERLVPLENVVGGDTDTGAVRTSLDRHRFAALAPFEALDYVPRSIGDRSEGSQGAASPVGPTRSDDAPRLWLASFARPRGAYSYALHDAVPDGEAEIRRHATVRDRHGHRVGTVGEVVVGAGTPRGARTELIVHSGRADTVRVPLSAVDRIDGDAIHLTVSRTELAAGRTR